MVTAEIHRALADVNDPAVLKQMIASLVASLDHAGAQVSSGYLRLKPERPVAPAKQRAEAIVP